MKKTHDYDNTFKTMKQDHKRLFIAVINECFHKNYPMDCSIEVLPADLFFMEPDKENAAEITERDSDLILRIGNDYYILECQTYDDDSMAIRIAEYTFLTARNYALWDKGRAILDMPHFTVIYVKATGETPKFTTITYRFPNGKIVDYSEENVFINNLSKEEIIQKKLYAYIPFYIARYEKQLSTQEDYEDAIKDLAYFRDEMIKLHKRKELSDDEWVDLRQYVNTIVTHITDGNRIEKEVAGIMGGTVYESESKRLKREGREEVQPIIDELSKQLEENKHQLEKNKAQLAEKDKRIAELEALLAQKN